MTPVEITLFVLLALAGIVLSAIFSGSETGLYTINRVRLAVRANGGDVQAQRILAIRRDTGRMLAMLLIGNNIANQAGSYGVAALLDGAGISAGQAIIINAAILIPLLFIFGEVLPKDLFRTHTDRWTYKCSTFQTWVGRILTWTGLVPLVEAFGKQTARIAGGGNSDPLDARARVGQLIKEGHSAGVLSAAQTSLVDRALALRDLTVRDEMVPWRQAVTMPVGVDERTRRTIMRGTTYTRLPVTDGQRIVGVLSTIDAVLNSEGPVEPLMKPPFFLFARTPLRQALREMRLERQSMAIVVEHGSRRPVGLVTLKDLVEPLTGELEAF